MLDARSHAHCWPLLCKPERRAPCLWPLVHPLYRCFAAHAEGNSSHIPFQDGMTPSSQSTESQALFQLMLLCPAPP